MATAAAANESRSELLGWMSELLQMNITKIEQVGTGAILCQIVDSIYGDVAMHKVKFNTHQEYEYVNNFKVLQSAFTAHGIEKEFLQWMKKFWDSNYPGGSYDAVSRRKGATPSQATAPAMKASNVRSGPLRASTCATATIPPCSPNLAAVNRGVGYHHGSSSAPTSVGQMQQTISTLNKTVTELRLTVDEMEKERDFYFAKLRDIEVITQSVTDPVLLESSLFKQITEILYKTEEGFVLPEDAPTEDAPIAA